MPLPIEAPSVDACTLGCIQSNMVPRADRENAWDHPSHRGALAAARRECYRTQVLSWMIGSSTASTISITT
ncbi:MAG TPA: hypothetical protein PLO07_15530, partial [Rubrivivax sp.]|nr:hypothetical protein [Rubrivivax sp.]